jgi:hypothetical protein
MTARRRPSRLALTLLDVLAAENAPLKGDLIEEFEIRQSQLWLWGQVIGALVHHRRPFHTRDRRYRGIPFLGAVLVALLSFEIVFVTNVLYRLLFGPPPPNISGYFFLFQRGQKLLQPVPDPYVAVPPATWLYPSLLALALAVPAGWWLVRLLSGDNRRVSIAVVVTGILLWATLNIRLPFVAQFVSMLALTTGFLAGGRLAAAADEWRARVRDAGDI